MILKDWHGERLQGDRIFLRLLEKSDAPRMLRLYQENRLFLKPWEPQRDTEFFTLASQESQLEVAKQLALTDQGYVFGIFISATGELAGRITLSNVVRGVMQGANLGYFMAQKHNGKGYMTAAIGVISRFAFKELGLHRLQAATLLHNHGSIRALEKAGFRREGQALRYLKINNAWQDHFIFALTAEECQD